MDVPYIEYSQMPARKDSIVVTMPKDIPIIDTLISFPTRDKKAMHASTTAHTKDAESKEIRSSRLRTCS